MKTLKSAFFIALILSLALCFALAVACGDDDDSDSDDENANDDLNDDADDDVDDDDSDAGGTWTDSTTGLMWQNPPSTEGMKNDDAIPYCENLIAGGYEDWRLPDIGELRSLVRECPITQTGGECEVEDGCLWDCFDLNCNGCEYEQGPASDGCYWNDALSGTCEWYWSSSEDENESLWGIHFRNGAIGVDDSDDEVPPFTRCVR